MPLLKYKRTLCLCSATLFVASVGFSLSVLATVVSFLATTYFWSDPPPPPASILLQAPKLSPAFRIDKDEKARAIVASTPSSTSSPPPIRTTVSINSARSVSPRPTPPRSDIETPQQSALQLPGSPTERSRSPRRRKTSPSPLRSLPPTNTRHAYQIERDVEPDIPKIALSPAPAKLHFEETRPSTSTSSTLVASEPDEFASHRGRKPGRLRSKIVQLFGGDKKREKSTSRVRKQEHVQPPPAPDRRHSMPPPTNNTLSLTIPQSSSFVPPPEPMMCSEKDRSRSLMLRVASCPIMHHSRQDSIPDTASSLLSPTTDSAPSSPSTSPLSPTIQLPAADPEEPQTPQRKSRSKSLKARNPCKSGPSTPTTPTPKLRTQPYAAPYFIPTPDTDGVEEPLSPSTLTRERERRNPSRRRTMPPESETSPTSIKPTRRMSGLGMEVFTAADLAST
ncbi:hypothetical protein MIND_00548500 [Mycena indigotica]|uniref:Uncharacterized protein n=1 Tax=Mycena indigotica TaxID=2126181 RepID=A0A8H6SZB4_9AGAR|nr:uncharacterized protein MIND_00548500 [Mycena indigotica]KAF7307537.1 hypothetical protein MIND_00548500 [Mycena indigotica]